ncbi:8-amino-7-oxononanoate synthase [uncultured Azohydromonas sp.]|jgi:8-amino-7-oxononanoate synthase|uniref:8-amino-7-oxononanoate synthase n=1 Tax=uncultured Azohydromonas sp. TaxID=487342 RepID=UPI00261A52EF|nr:8-amino-7-oxononanoate synthase [uncultured Azohydromonas sp.]
MLIQHINRRLLELDAAALRRRLRTAESPCTPQQSFEGEQGGEPLLAFCSNDYLGLAHHPALIEAMAEGARRWGTGSGASHLVSGHMRPHAQVEELVARWFAPHIPHARALLMGSGFEANLALTTALGDGSATLFCDKLNHASLIDGARLAEGEVKRYAHGRLDVLAQQLAACTTPIKLIVTDAVFSMDGDIADLPGLLKLAEAHDAWLILDDAHGLGVLGESGHGSVEHFGLRSERLICMGTLGKAAGVSGAFVVAHPAIIEWLIQKARSFIYTTASSPALAHTLLASLKLIESPEGRARRARLLGLIEQLRTGLRALVEVQPGWKLGESPTAIQPLIVGDNDTALNLSAALRRRGLYVPAMRPPTVPVGTARLRITLSAGHTPAQVEQLLLALAQAMGEAR